MDCIIFVHKMVVIIKLLLKLGVCENKRFGQLAHHRAQYAKLEGFNAVQCSCFDVNPTGKRRKWNA